MIVKICANKDIQDAKMCLDAKADIIGVLVGQRNNSDDFISKEMAKSIVKYVDKKCDVSLVTHLTDAEEIIDLTSYIGNSIIQLHSNIDEKEVEKISNSLPDIKLVRLIQVSPDGKIVNNISDMKYVDYYLIDSFNLKTNQIGGTGITSNWSKCGEIIKSLNKPTFLAGGLTQFNVIEAIRLASPYGVDVNSGCKDDSGRKQYEKVKQFVEMAKSQIY